MQNTKLAIPHPLLIALTFAKLNFPTNWYVVIYYEPVQEAYMQRYTQNIIQFKVSWFSNNDAVVGSKHIKITSSVIVHPSNTFGLNPFQMNIKIS